MAEVGGAESTANGNKGEEVDVMSGSVARSPVSPSKRESSPVRRRSRSRSGSPRKRSNSRSRSPAKSPKSNVPESKVLGVFGLSSSTTEDDLRYQFEKFGETNRVELIMDKRTFQSRCFGFIYFVNLEDAVKAKEACNGMVLHGRTIRTDFSLTSRPHSPTPGRYMGRVRRNDRDRGPPRRVDRYMPSRIPRGRDRFDPYYDDRYRGRDYYDDRYDDRRYDSRRYDDRRYDDRRYDDRRYDDRRYDRNYDRYDDRY